MLSNQHLHRSTYGGTKSFARVMALIDFSPPTPSLVQAITCDLRPPQRLSSIMIQMNRYKRTSALPAIAAALALSSTPVLAQEVQPVPTDPAPAAQPAPTAPTDATPSTTDTSTAAEPDTATADSATSAHAATAKPVVHRTAAKAMPTVARTAARKVTASKVASAAPAVAKPAPAAAPATTASTSTRPAPIVDLSAKPAATPAVAPKPAHHKRDATLPIAGGALAFLAIGGAAAAITRRRHDDEEELVNDEPMASAEPPVAIEPVVHEEQPTIVAPAAFAWEGAEQARDGETYVERAQRGPTPENPSLSLKKRLKRAAALDKRESDVAAGKAEPMDPMAGLPEAMAD